MAKSLQRCPWLSFGDPLYLEYHDKEWGVPVRDDRKIYEFLVLEVFQAGLSWRTVLYKRENFRKAFANFDFNKVAKFTNKDVARLLKNPGIIRNRAKIEAAINNAKKLLEIRKEYGTFSKYMWQWVDPVRSRPARKPYGRASAGVTSNGVDGKPIINKIRTLKDYKPYTKEAIDWSKDLKERGFKFLGPTVVYAHMQAVGMTNDHTANCFRYKELK